MWAPQEGPQQALISCPFEEIFFGGARGGGKTDGVLGFWAIKERRYGAAFNAIAFRRTTVSSEDAIERSKQIYKPLGGKFNESKLIWRMPNGGRVSFKYLETTKDAEEYQGRNVTDAWVEEAGQFPDPEPIDMLFGALRSSVGVPEQLVLTGNPGGAGQHWIAQRYNLIPFPDLPQVVVRNIETDDGVMQHKMAVIPSRLNDNKIMLARSKNYKTRLHLVGSKELVRAWLDGDWSAVPGAFFDCFSQKRHVVRPFKVPDTWMRFASMDWGGASPFSVGWWAVASDPITVEGSEPGTSIFIPRGAMVRYREWYGASGPNKGLKLANEQVSRGILEREAGEKITYRVIDPGAGQEHGGPSIKEEYARAGVHFKDADNTRVARDGHISGWAQVRSRLIGERDGAGSPMIFFFSTCRDSIRTLPALQHDRKNPEDLDTNSEDHAADEIRYACMSRPWVPTPQKRPSPLDAFRGKQPKGSTSWKTV